MRVNRGAGLLCLLAGVMRGTTGRGRYSNARKGDDLAGPTREPLGQADEPSAMMRVRVRRPIRLMAGFVSM
jgi:hypothetical protein